MMEKLEATWWFSSTDTSIEVNLSDFKLTIISDSNGIPSFNKVNIIEPKMFMIMASPSNHQDHHLKVVNVTLINEIT